MSSLRFLYFIVLVLFGPWNGCSEEIVTSSMKSQRCFLSIRCIWAVRVIIIGCLLGSLTSSAVAQEDEDEDSNIKEDYKEDLSTELPEPKPVNKHASAVRHFGVPKYRGEFISSKDSYKVDEWRPGFEGLGTIHEQMGENHWPKPIFTKYESTVTYQGQIIYPKMGMTPIYNFTHYLFQSTLSDPPYLPDGKQARDVWEIRVSDFSS